MDFSWPVTPLISFEGTSADGLKPIILTPGKPYFVRGWYIGWGPRSGYKKVYLLVGVNNCRARNGQEVGYPADQFIRYNPPKESHRDNEKSKVRQNVS